MCNTLSSWRADYIDQALSTVHKENNANWFARHYRHKRTSAPGSRSRENDEDSIESDEQSHSRPLRRSSNSLPDLSDCSQGSNPSQPSSAESAAPKTPPRTSFKPEYRMRQWVSPLRSKFHREEKALKAGNDFRTVMREITNDHDLMLSDTDMDLFLCLKGQESFKAGNCAAQLESSGICVEFPKGTAMPKAPDNAWSFRYGPEQRKVVLVPELLTALGFSVISWIFTATEEYKPLFELLVKAVTFENSLIATLTAQEATNASSDKGEKIVIPMGWLYTLGVDSSFVLEHGEYGDFGAALGNRVKSSCKDEEGV